MRFALKPSPPKGGTVLYLPKKNLILSSSYAKASEGQRRRGRFELFPVFCTKSQYVTPVACWGGVQYSTMYVYMVAIMPNLRGRVRDAEILRAYINPTERVLDLGSGAGMLARDLQALTGAHLTLIDTVDYHKVALPFQLYDGTRIPFPNKHFDVTLLALVLHHLPHYGAQQDLLREVRRVTKRSILIIEIAPAGVLEWFLQAAWDMLANLPHGVSVTFLYRPLKGWRDLFHSVGARVAKEVRWNRFFSVLLFVLDVE